jgi:hypothetical protein
VKNAGLPIAIPSGRHVAKNALSTPMAAQISAVRPAASSVSWGPRMDSVPDIRPGTNFEPAWPATWPTVVTSPRAREWDMPQPATSLETSFSFTSTRVDDPWAKAMSAHHFQG